MKSFRQLVEEKTKSLAILFGRMNPPTKGHEENVNGLKKLAKENNADHLVVASHSHDAKKNPLDVATKMKHLKRAFPDTNITSSSKEKPNVLNQAVDAYKKGYNHLILASGEDRADEMHHLLHKYNGVEGRHGYFKFDHIESKSTGERKPGISGTDMRNHVTNGNFKDFKKNLPSAISKNPTHSAELFHDVSKGLGLNEDVERGRYKAIFVTGGPGSGKDVVLRECIAEQKIVELNFTQIGDILNDKHRLALRSMNPKNEAVRTRGPLIINGPADDNQKIAGIKEELEELGYETMMVFVDTTDNVSKERNTQLARMMSESVRQERWEKSHSNITIFTKLFENFVRFDNSGSLEDKVDEISEMFVCTTDFLDQKVISENTNRFMQIYEAKGNAKTMQRSNLRLKGLNVLKDGNVPFMQAQAKAGKIDDVRDGDAKMNKDYIYRQYSESKFEMDNDKSKRLSRGDKSLSAARPVKPDGVGSTYDTRAGGQGAAAGAGLGNQTYSEDNSRGGTREFSNDDVANFSGIAGGPKPNPLKEKKTLRKFREAIDSPGENAMGVGGVLGGASNKEPMVTPADKYGQSGITIKKKKTGAN